MMTPTENTVTVVESGNGRYAQFVTAGHHVMGADEPENLGGSDTGPSPYEYVMAGLGACTVMTLRMYASRKQWPLAKVSVVLRHERTTSADSKVDRFERIIQLMGDLTDSQRARLLEIAEKCPVSQTLQRPSLVVSSLADTITPALELEGAASAL